MEASSIFINQLKDVDEKLSVNWNAQKQRWQILREDYRVKHFGFIEDKPALCSVPHPYLVFTVENEDKSYRPLDQRTLDHLNFIDLYRHNSIKDFLDNLESEEDSFKEKKSLEDSDLRQEIAKFNYEQLKDGLEEMRRIT